MTDKYAAWTRPPPHKKHWFTWIQRRSIHVIAFILLLSAIVGVVIGQIRLSQQSAEHTAAATLQILASQYSLLLADAVETGDTSMMNISLERLLQAPAMTEAAIYRIDGGRISSRKRSATEPATVTTVIMMPITGSQDNAIGMLKIVADENALLNNQYRLIRRSWALQSGLVITGLLAGIILTLGCWRYRFTLRNNIR